MSADRDLAYAKEQIEGRFAEKGLSVINVAVREYPGETIFIVSVPPSEVSEATTLGNDLDSMIATFGIKGFVTVRPSESLTESLPGGAVTQGVGDPRAPELIRLLTSRSRTSETQPSLTYVRDVAANISAVTTPRHHLVFGRRGAGKTALLAEAKRTFDAAGHMTVWINLQSYRQIPPAAVFLWVLRKWVDAMQGSLATRSDIPAVSTDLARISDQIESLLAEPKLTNRQVALLVPRMQLAARKYQDTFGRETFIFLDDYHYISRSAQPWLLDTLHGCTRDCDVWMKIATIKHLSKWFQTSPPLGLQAGHDAELIDLDISLQDPLEAKDFLQRVLQSYAAHVQVRSLYALFSPEGLDRLVLASGAVPRDYLVLAADSLRRARRRPKGKLVGAQDVNRAAGDAARAKIRELEEDLAANEGESGKTLGGLARLRGFCLDFSRSSYFRVDFADKERSTDAYNILTALLDLRLVHLVNASVSDERRAGARAEVFMLDLSQFSGERFKRNIRVLDFSGRHLVLREAGKATRVGKTPNALLAILRRGPLLRLNDLEQSEGAAYSHQGSQPPIRVGRTREPLSSSSS